MPIKHPQLFYFFQLYATLSTVGALSGAVCSVQLCRARAEGVLSTHLDKKHLHKHGIVALQGAAGVLFVFSVIPLFALHRPLLLSLGLAKGRPRGKAPTGFPVCTFPSSTL